MASKRSHQGTVIEKRPIIGRGFLESSPAKPLAVIYASSRAPFMSLVNRAIKELDKGPGGAKWSATKVLPLQERIDAAQKATTNGTASQGVAAMASGRNRTATRQREVLLVASGHAIEKLLLVAAWFRRRGEYVVALRTFWSSTVDNVVGEAAREDGDGHGESETQGEAMDMEPGPEVFATKTRLRQVSCLELAVRLK